MARLGILPSTAASPRRGRPLWIFKKLGLAAVCLLVGLILVGQILFLTKAVQSGALTSGSNPVRVPATGPLAHRVSAVVANALGPSDRGVRRFAVTSVRSDRRDHRLADVAVRWAINSDLSAGTIGNGAAAEVYVMLRDLFTSHLPLAQVQLDGTYPLPESHSRTRETTVMRLEMTRSSAALVDGAGWDSLEPQTFWPLVRRLYVNPQFVPLPSE